MLVRGSVHALFSFEYLGPVNNSNREMALGNTFGATSFCSYGAYWITFAIFSDLDITVTATDAGVSVCQKETLMGLFMVVCF